MARFRSRGFQAWPPTPGPAEEQERVVWKRYPRKSALMSELAARKVHRSSTSEKPKLAHAMSVTEAGKVAMFSMVDTCRRSIARHPATPAMTISATKHIAATVVFGGETFMPSK
ncbi:hypothetical protein GCM10020258_45750 [Sphingomonas yabuuchiae]